MTSLDTLAEARGRKKDGGVSLWGRLARSPLYAGLSDFLTASAGRRLAFLVAPPLLWALVMHAGPLLRMGHISLLDSYPPDVGHTPEFTLQHYRAFFTSPVHWAPFSRTFLLAFVTAVTTLVVTYPIAYFLARHAPRRQRFGLLLLLMAPFWAGELVRSFSLVLFFGNKGALNSLLLWLGVIEEPLPLLYTPFAVNAGMFYFLALYMLLPLYSAIEKVPASIFEAASDLGAGSFQRFWRVTLPMTRGGVGAATSLVFLMALGAYGVPLLLGGNETTLFSETIATFFANGNGQWAVGAAFSVILLVTALVLAGLYALLFNLPSERRPR